MIFTKKIRACTLAILQLLLLFSLSCNVSIYEELFEPGDQPFVSSITPNSGKEPAMVSITDLRGGLFMSGATVMLTRAGYPDIIATNVTVVSDTQIICTIDITGARFGQWNVVVTNPDGQSGVLSNCFTVISIIGGNFLGIPLEYTNNVLCMGGQSGFNNDGYAEGIGGNACGDVGYSWFYDPTSLTTDGIYLYIIDSGNYLLRSINIATRQSATIAGTPGACNLVDGIGPAARFFSPRFITNDGKGTLYLTDEHTVRSVNLSNSNVTTIAGQFNTPGSIDGTGTAALFNSPQGITTDGVYLYIADGNCTIRKMNIATGLVTTIAGMPGVCDTVDGIGPAARMTSLMGMTTDGTYLYFTQCFASGHMRIRRLLLSNNEVTTLAGNSSDISADGTGTAASFRMPIGITCDGTNLFVIGWEGDFRQIVIATRKVTTLPGGDWNNRGITYDGTSLYIASPHINEIDAKW
jgi:hypothetical protein